MIMNKAILLPNYFKKIGWITAAAVTIFWIITRSLDICVLGGNIYCLDMSYGEIFFGLHEECLDDTIIIILGLISLMFICFSREKREDEYIGRIREKSLVWSLWANTILLVAGSLFIYGIPYLQVMIVNIFSLPVIFALKFNYSLYRFRHCRNEE